MVRRTKNYGCGNKSMIVGTNLWLWEQIYGWGTNLWSCEQNLQL
jgi:hypothetical protein